MTLPIALDRDKESPLFERIKRLGIATADRNFEPITQATFVEMLLLYISNDPKHDRDILLRGGAVAMASGDDIYKLPFRNMFVKERDIEIGEIVLNYFEAVKRRWPDAWDFRGRGRILHRTNGFRALMRFLRYAYLEVASPGDVPSAEKFLDNFRSAYLRDDDFTIENFPPGTAGEAKLVRVFRPHGALRPKSKMTPCPRSPTYTAACSKMFGRRDIIRASLDPQPVWSPRANSSK